MKEQTCIFNLAVALIEGRTTDAREIYRGNPDGFGRITMSEIQSRLNRALTEAGNRTATDLLHRMLLDMLSIDAPADLSESEKTIFMRGVVHSEEIIEGYLKPFGTEVLPTE